jgi:hypothetical protein
LVIENSILLRPLPAEGFFLHAPKRSKKELLRLMKNRLNFTCSTLGEKNSVDNTSLKHFFSVPTSSETFEAVKFLTPLFIMALLNHFVIRLFKIDKVRSLAVKS